MFVISNQYLVVSILDPVADVKRLGSRYCTGGYIWQIEDRRLGPLLAGRSYPDPFPSSFDGQGAPEAFVVPLGRDGCAVGETVTVIGVGEVRKTSTNIPFHVRDNPEVVRFCSWNVETLDQLISMSTGQHAYGYRLTITRRVELDGRKVVSYTEVTNMSSEALPIRWFAHPFFPINRDGRCFRPAFSCTVPENPGYLLNEEDRTLYMNEKYDWIKGLFQKIDVSAGARFTAQVYHPLLFPVYITADYELESLAVWANDRTFSPEPFLFKKVAPDCSHRWKVEYRFGE